MEEVEVNLERVSINQALKLIQQNVQDKKLAFVLEDNKCYFLNDHTINKLMKGLVDENAIVQYKDQVKGPIQQTKDSDAEWVEYFDSVKTLKLIIVKAKTDKTKPGGGFFKYYHTTKYDLRRFAVYKEDDDPDYAENCLVTALREGGLSDDKIQMVKLFVMNRIRCVPPQGYPRGHPLGVRRGTLYHACFLRRFAEGCAVCLRCNLLR